MGNFYCTVRGKRQCVPMSTGDSCIITPFVPHSFTTRDASQYSAIVAVTFSTSVRDALADLVFQDAGRMLAAAGDARDPAGCRELRIRRFAELRGMQMHDIEALLSRASETGFDSKDEDMMLSAALKVPVSFLTVQEVQEDQEVQFAYGSRIPDAAAGSNLKKPLASALHMPECGGYEWQISAEDSMDCQFFNYIYNHGDVTLHMQTETGQVLQSRALEPGDSMVLKPFVKINVSPGPNTGQTAKIIIVKVPGCVGKQVLDEIATFAAEGRGRMTSNLEQWW